MTPFAESERRQAIRARATLRDASAAFGVTEGLSEEEME